MARPFLLTFSMSFLLALVLACMMSTAAASIGAEPAGESPDEIAAKKYRRRLMRKETRKEGPPARELQHPSELGEQSHPRTVTPPTGDALVQAGAKARLCGGQTPCVDKKADFSWVPVSGEDAGMRREVFGATGLPTYGAGFENTAPDKIAQDYVDEQVEFQPGDTAWPGLTSEAELEALVVWTGRLRIGIPGDYSFELHTEGPSRFYIGPTEGIVSVLVDKDNGPGHNEAGSTYLETGVQNVKIEYYRTSHAAGIAWKYKGPDTSAITRSVPREALSLPRATCDTLESCPLGFRRRPRGDMAPLPCFGPVCEVHADIVPCCVPLLKGMLSEVYRFEQLEEIPELDGILPQVRNTVPMLDFAEGHDFRDVFGTSVGANASLSGSTAVRFTGVLKISTTGHYNFKLNSQDGSRLILDSANVITVDNDGMHSMNSSEGEAVLKRGHHNVQIDYFQANDAGGMEWSYNGPDSGNAWKVVPENVLFQPAAQCSTLVCPRGYARKPQSETIACVGEVCDPYYDRDNCCRAFPRGLDANVFIPLVGESDITEEDLKRDPQSNRTDSQLNFAPSASNVTVAWPGYQVMENFGVQWKGNILILQQGNYQFELSGRKWAQLFLDSVNASVCDLSQGSADDDGVSSDAGDVGGAFQSGMHRLRLDYMQPAGAPFGPAAIVLRYKGPDTKDDWVVVPENRLFRPRANCSSLKCPDDYTILPNGVATPCFGSVCSIDMDLDTCCFTGSLPEAQPEVQPVMDSDTQTSGLTIPMTADINNSSHQFELVGSFDLVVDEADFASNPQAAMALRKGLAEFFNCSAGVLLVELLGPNNSNVNSTSNATDKSNATASALLARADLHGLLSMFSIQEAASEAREAAEVRVTVRFQVWIPNAVESTDFAEAAQDRDRLDRSLSTALRAAAFGNTVTLDSPPSVQVVPRGFVPTPSPTPAPPIETNASNASNDSTVTGSGDGVGVTENATVQALEERLVQW